jgi:hypothetical protein
MNVPSAIPNSLTGRTRYRSSGLVDIGPFLAWTLLALAVAAALAAFMYWLFDMGQYYVIIVPALCGLAVAGMAVLAVARGHCRNRAVALFTGVLLAIVLYIGSYYIGMIHQLGPRTATRMDVLVQYIRLRMATDVERSSTSPADDEDRPRRHRGSEGSNWVRFGIESVFVLGFVTVAAYRRSQKGYCERCKRWLTRETSPFEPGQAPGLIESLQLGSARALAAVCATPPYTTLPNTTLAVDYCPSLKEGRAQDCPAFISLKNVTANAKGLALDAFEQAKGKVIERGVQLNPEELPALAPRFPVFEAYAGRAAVASLLPKAEPETVSEAVEPEGKVAKITPLDPEHNGKVFTRKMMWIGNAFAFVGFVGFLGGLLLLGWGASMLEQPGHSAAGPNAAGIALCAVGGLLVLIAVAGVFFDSSFGGNRHLRKAFKAELGRRTGLLVTPDDPDALFVEIVPKLNWGKTMLDNASDIGLLLVDRARRELRFEGDKERWVIPAETITSCEVEKFVHGQGTAKTRIFYVVLRATRREGFWEAPIRERRPHGIISASRKKLARRLAGAIGEIRGVVPVSVR